MNLFGARKNSEQPPPAPPAAVVPMTSREQTILASLRDEPGRWLIWITPESLGSRFSEHVIARLKGTDLSIVCGREHYYGAGGIIFKTPDWAYCGSHHFTNTFGLAWTNLTGEILRVEMEKENREARAKSEAALVAAFGNGP